MNIYQKIYQLRKNKKLNQTKFGEMLGVSRITVSSWENGTASPRLEHLEKILTVFNFDFRNNRKNEVALIKSKKLTKENINDVFLTADDRAICPMSHSSDTFALNLQYDKTNLSDKSNVMAFFDPNIDVFNNVRVLVFMFKDEKNIVGNLLINNGNKYLKIKEYPLIPQDDFEVIAGMLGYFVQH